MNNIKNAMRKTCALCLKHDGILKNVPFFAFPPDSALLGQWKSFCGPKYPIKSSHSYVCGLHFTPNDFVEPNAKTKGTSFRLLPNSVPSIMEGNETNNIFNKPSENTVGTNATPSTIKQQPVVIFKPLKVTPLNKDGKIPITNLGQPIIIKGLNANTPTSSQNMVILPAATSNVLPSTASTGPILQQPNFQKIVMLPSSLSCVDSKLVPETDILTVMSVDDKSKIEYKMVNGKLIPVKVPINSKSSTGKQIVKNKPAPKPKPSLGHHRQSRFHTPRFVSEMNTYHFITPTNVRNNLDKIKKNDKQKTQQIRKTMDEIKCLDLQFNILTHLKTELEINKQRLQENN